MNDRVDSIDLCVCGRARLEPEGSVPVTGFSRELRDAVDVQRFRFSFPLRGEVFLPVHLVFSAAERRAELKAGDLKVFRVGGVGSACEAQGRWIEWWRSGQAGPVFSAPRRTGRSPRPLPATS
jgi:hypothetical protein